MLTMGCVRPATAALNFKKRRIIMERIEKAIRDYMALQQEHYEWKKERAERLDTQNERYM